MKDNSLALIVLITLGYLCQETFYFIARIIKKVRKKWTTGNTNTKQ